MDVREQLRLVHSKANNKLIIGWVGQDADRFAEVMECFLGDEYRLVQRSAWVVGEVAKQQPNLMRPYTLALLEALENPLHEAVQRNGFRFIADTKFEFDEDEEGRLVGLAFDLLDKPKTPVAIRVHALQCMANICERYPELAEELMPFVQEGLDDEKPAMRSRCKRVYKQLQKLAKG